MPCTHVQLPGGSNAIVCTSTARCACGRRAHLLCDWKVKGKTSGTCDKPICEDCTYVPAADKDLCPAHAVEWVSRLRATETKGPGGLVLDSYVTRGGERAYRIAWDDKVNRPLAEIDAEVEFADGARVRLVGRHLRKARP